MTDTQKILKIQLPVKPLTVSKAWQGRRFATRAYKDWTKEVVYEINNQIRKAPVRSVGGKVEVTVELHVKNDKMMDVDNCLKTLLDTLTKSKVYKDDRMIYALHVYKYHANKEHIVVIISDF